MADDEVISVVEMTPINMDQNKESLEKKFQARRSKSDLEQQNILRATGAPAVFAKETINLKFAKTRDIINSNLKNRHDRRYLEDRNILEEASQSIGPALQGHRKKLKRSFLKESISEHLLTRPGPLELVQGHILPADEGLLTALNEGQVQYRTSAEAFGSLADLSPDNTQSPPSYGGDDNVFASTPFIPPAPDITPLLLKQRPKASLSPVQVASAQQQLEGGKAPKPRRNSSKKTPKMIASQNAGARSNKSFKFHFIGPGQDKNVPKPVKAVQGAGAGDSTVSNFDIIMQQQLVFLQYQSAANNAAASTASAEQLMPPPTSFKLNKSAVNTSNPVTTAIKTTLGDLGSVSTTANFGLLFNAQTAVSAGFSGSQQPVAVKSSASTTSCGDQLRMGKFESMTVKQLQAELRARNVSGSGTKQQLLERLRSLGESVLQSQAERDNAISASDSSTLLLPDDSTLDSDMSGETAVTLDHQMSRPASRAPMDVDVEPSRSVVNFTVNPLASGSFAMTSVNPLVWPPQPPPMMTTMPLQAMFAPALGSPALLPTDQQQQLSWLPVSVQQQLLQQQMAACSQSVQQANAQIQQHQATLLALQQQHELITSHPLQQSAATVTEGSSSRNPAAQTPSLSASWSSGQAAAAKRLSSEEMMLLQQQQQIQQLYTALQQSQQRLLEAQQQASQQAQYYASLQQQYLAAMTTGQQHTSTVSPQHTTTSVSRLPLHVTVPTAPSDVKMSASVPSSPVGVGNGHSKVSRTVTDPMLCGLVDATPPSRLPGAFVNSNNNQFADANSTSAMTDDLVDMLFEHRGASGTFAAPVATSHQPSHTSHSPGNLNVANEHFTASHFSDIPFDSRASEATIFDLSSLLSPAQVDMTEDHGDLTSAIGCTQTAANLSTAHTSPEGNYTLQYSNPPFAEWTADSVLASSGPTTSSSSNADTDFVVSDFLHTPPRFTASQMLPVHNGTGQSTPPSQGYSNGYAVDFDWTDVVTSSSTPVAAKAPPKCHPDVLDLFDVEAGTLMIGFDTGFDRLPVVTTANGGF